MLSNMKRITCLVFSMLCVTAFGGNADQRDFASKCASIWLSSDAGSLAEFILPDQREIAAKVGMISCWSKIRLQRQNALFEFNPKDLSIRRIMLREPNQNLPRSVLFDWGEGAEASINPDKIAVIYLSDDREIFRVVLVFSLAQRADRYWLVPMNTVREGKSLKEEAEGLASISGKDVSACPGVLIVKMGQDMNSYGFLRPKPDEDADRVFRTSDQGCTLAHIFKEGLDANTWAFGLHCFPTGRFRVSAVLPSAEDGHVGQKVQEALVKSFGLQSSLKEKFGWNGYRVTSPQILPATWKKSSMRGSRQWKGNGEFRGYTIEQLIRHAIPDQPLDIVGPLGDEVFDLDLDVWPEAGGEMEALRAAGFIIQPITISHRTLVISPI
jgi:hypothetical protein